MFGMLKRAKAARISERGGTLNARYDAAQTTDENRRHWGNADYLSADAATSPEVRRTLRARARYETANNTYARGIVNTLADYIVGTGPRLQVLLDDDEANRVIEREFTRWARSIDLAARLRSMKAAETESGEVFARLKTNNAIDGPVQLDICLIEADQVATPTIDRPDETGVDGIVFDDDGNPITYHVLRQHPGSSRWLGLATEFEPVPADLVIHLFHAARPGQSRGIPAITPALPLFALLRRYTLAVVGSAEQAALIGGVIYTDGPAAETADVEPMDKVELDRNTWMTLPAGWKLGQPKAEQPTTMYGDFKRHVIAEIARCLNMPFNIAAGDSSGYNYASGRLDHQSFFRSLRIEQQRIEHVVLDRLLAAWLDEAALVEGLLPGSARTLDAAGGRIPHQWFWDGFEHVDPLKEANAQKARLAANTTTLAAEYARQGLDWEQELRQRGREAALMRELQLTLADAVDDDADDQDDPEDAASEPADARV